MNALPVVKYLYDAGATAIVSGMGNGNRTHDGTVLMTYDAQDRLTGRGSTTYGYNDAGERTSKSSPATTYAYNAAGTLRTVTIGATKYIYTIDGEGRRVARSKLVGTTTTLDEQYIYHDHYRVAAVLDPAGAIRWRFVYATGRYTPDYAIDATGILYRIVTDQVGSVRLVVRADATDAGTGHGIVQRTDYDAWGNATDIGPPPAHPLPLGFAGGLYDRDTKLVHFGAREYDPETGVWMSKDPTSFAGGMNVYGYAGNDPVNVVDTNGLIGLDEADLQAYAVPESGRWHTDRNEHNRCPERVPSECASAKVWAQDGVLLSTSLGHGDVQKWRSSSGDECIYSATGDLVLGGETYNYGSTPSTFTHIYFDFLAHFYYGGDAAYTPGLTVAEP